MYLKHALGPTVSFLFAWSSFWVVRPGNIGAMAMVFAAYFSQLVPDAGIAQTAWGIAAVILLSGVNLIGLHSGKWMQNVLTVSKIAGICSIVGLALFSSDSASTPDAAVITQDGTSNLWIAILFVMFTFGGWNDISFVAGEIRHPGRNLWRCLMLGIAIVTTVYAIFNTAIVATLGFDAMTQSDAVATDLVTITLGERSIIKPLIASLVCVSCLGAINGMILTSPRIYYAAGQDYDSLSFLSRWDAQRNCPWQAVLLQTVVTTALIGVCSFYGDGFEVLVVCTGPWFYTFLGLTFVSMIVLRLRESATDSNELDATSFRVPLFPLAPLFSAIVCAAVTINGVKFMMAQGYLVPGGIILALMVIGFAVLRLLTWSTP